LFGRVVPVPEANVRVLEGGETVAVAGRRLAVEYTPGHASHHVSYLHEPTGTALVGDVAGVRIEGGPILPPTPPPDVDLEAWHTSLRTVAAWDPERIANTHYGTWEDVGAHLEAMHEQLDRWAEVSRRTGDEEYAAKIEAAMRDGGVDGPLMDAYLRAMPPTMLWAGWERYWALRAQAG
jgi:glyoxylase-like metal-dependent hydrolase (beta-lactamase superfamily II)